MAADPTKKSSGPNIGLTNMQRLIWAGQHLDPDAAIYNMALRFEISAPLDVPIFARAFRHIVAESPVLRTTFPAPSGFPLPIVLPEASFAFPLLDFSIKSDPASAAREWCIHRVREFRFNLDQLLIDTALIKLSADKFVWFICQHHIICDAWSMAALFKLQGRVYREFNQGKSPAPLPEFTPPRAPVSVPIDPATTGTRSNPKTSTPTYYGKSVDRPGSNSVRVSLASGETARVQALLDLARRPDLRTFSPQRSQLQVFLTLFAAFLARVTDQRRLSIGLPFHNRRTPVQKQALGVFIEIYPVTISIESNDTFQTLYQRVRTAVHDYLTRAATGISAAPGASHRFTAILNFINSRFGDFDGAPTESEWLDNGYCDHEHAVRLHVQDFSGSGIPRLDIDLNRDIFGPAQIPETVEHFNRLIDAMVDDWHQPIEQIDLLGKDEREQQQVAFNATPALAESRSIAERFNHSVKNFPHRIAVRENHQTWTYQQLDERAESIAAQFPPISAGKSSRLAICLSRSVDAVATMIAALRHGYTFVPLDPAWPDQRMAYVTTHADVVTTVTTSKILPRLPKDCPHLILDQDLRSSPTARPAAHPNSSTAAAYLLYTSGSTGEPKGVEVSRQALAHYVNWAANYYDQGNPLIFPLFTPLAFDLTLTSIFVPLVNGGEIVVYPETDDVSDLGLLDVIRENRVNIIKLTPSHLGLLAERTLPGSKVHQLILGGEDLRTELAQRAFNAFPDGLKIHNEYGPTEATVGCVIQTITSDDLTTDASVPIGSPITGVQAFVLDKSKNFLPTGIPGELYISGPSLASGYFQQPELTAAVFLPHPSDPDQRLYRTGDLVRFNSAGSLTYLGRLDQQVKINGARVELGAIDSALLSLPAITHAATTTFGPAPVALNQHHCQKCGIPSDYPDTNFDDHGVCNHCRSFAEYESRAQIYFHPLEKLAAKFSERQNPSAPYDCIALLSGGKDSTYMLARLADMGFRILAFTLENGYISAEAKSNIRRVVTALGVDHHFGSTEAMNQIFVDSLKRHANVCQGCFKTIYTLSLNLAREKQIPFIVTGLSRGQFFETRLTEDLFREPCATVAQIDQTVLDARKAYHRLDDAVSDHLDVSAVRTDELFEQVEIIDFYRYCDVDLDEMLAYLNNRLPWVRPSDTGRSTNCLINDVGIYVHQRNRGHHNYALPYSWDVRMGHKQREAALDELDDQIDVDDVHRILREIGYDGELVDPHQAQRLVGYYVSESEIPAEQLAAHLHKIIPNYMHPARLIRVDAIPLTSNGKTAWSQLPDPRVERPASSSQYVAPADEIESSMADIWSEVLQVSRLSVTDNFFDLGGDSILAIQIIARANRAGLRITTAQLFNHQSVRSLAQAYGDVQSSTPATAPRSSTILTPIQQWAVDHNWSEGQFWNQSIEIELLAGTTIAHVRVALHALIETHSALRTQVSSASRTSRVLSAPPPADILLVETTVADREQRETKLHQLLALGNEAQLGAVFITAETPTPRLLLIANHLAVDAVSWHLLLDQLIALLTPVSSTQTDSGIPPLHFDQWAGTLESAATSTHFESQIPHWKSILQLASPLPALAVSAPFPVSDQGQHTSELSPSLIRRLEQNLSGSRYRPDELLVAALVLTLSSDSTTGDLRLFIERHGRESIDPQVDFAQTIGWFTSLSPIKIQRTEQLETSDLLDAVKVSLRQQPDQGIGYGMLRYLHPDSAVRESLNSGPHEVIFNFLGKSTNRESTGLRITRPLQLHQSPTLHQTSLLTVVVSFEGSPRITWSYCQRRLTAEIVAAFDQQYSRHLHSLIEFALGESTKGASASDFPMAGLDDDEFNLLGSLLK